VAALEEALAQFGLPEVFNTDQGGQFTSLDFVDTLKAAGVRISMDGKGRWVDYYNAKRPHSRLDDHTPDEVYEAGALKEAA